MRLLCAIAIAAACALTPTLAEKKTVAGGRTQVVAKADGREITLSELRLEMGRLGLSPANPDAERLALESLLNRTLLAQAARASALHRKPEAMARIYAAQDQALADYYLGLASRPPEPAREEIDDFIRDNPSLFAARKSYDFAVLTLKSKYFDEKILTPLFDREPDFAKLAAVLERAGANHSTTTATQSGAAFPDPIREQLAAYAVRDNIVLKGEDETQIMKIIAIRPFASPASDWPPLARRMLMERAAAMRAQELMARLRERSAIAYYRPSATPKPQPEAN